MMKFDKLERLDCLSKYLIKVLIFYASEGGKQVLPTEKYFLLSEVAAAVCEYSSGERASLLYRDNREDTFMWCISVKERVMDVIGMDTKLNKRLKEAFLWLTDSSIDSDIIGYRSVSCRLFDFQGCLFDGYGFWADTARPSSDINAAKFLAVFDEEEKMSLKEVAKIMNRHIKEDVDFVSRHKSQNRH